MVLTYRFFVNNLRFEISNEARVYEWGTRFLNGNTLLMFHVKKILISQVFSQLDIIDGP